MGLHRSRLRGISKDLLYGIGEMGIFHRVKVMVSLHTSMN
jgi:hypothetical protein